MPKIMYVLFAIVSVQSYAVMYAVAASVVWDASRSVLNPFNLWRILREFVGVVARMYGTTVSLTGSWESVLGLNSENATQNCIDYAAMKVAAQMGERRWAYPASQYRALEGVTHTARSAIYARDRYRKALEDATRFFAALERQAAATGWRRVLGLAAQERDTSVIKKAYRKLASRAHPDHGGSNTVMTELNGAFEQARKELAFV